MPIILLLFSLIGYSSEHSSEQYCFSSEPVARSGLSKLKSIQVSSDTITHDGNCLVIQMASHRRELIQRFLRSNYPEVKINFSSEELKTEPCLLTVTKIKTKTSNQSNIGFSQYPIINAQDTNGAGVENMQIQTLKDFELLVDQDVIKGSCRHITPNRYEITLEVRKDPKPVLNNELPPPDQETMVLKTQLQLDRGQKIEIASVVREMNERNREINIKPNLNTETKSQNQLEKVFLSLQ